MSQVVLNDKVAKESAPGTGTTALEIVNGALVVQADDGTTQTQSGDNSGDQTSETLPVVADASSDYGDLQDILNTQLSTGIVGDTELITDAGSGAVDVAAANILIRATDSDTAEVKLFKVTAAASLALTDAQNNYLYAEYNAGTPQYVATTTKRTDTNTNILIGSVYRDGTTVHINNTRRVRANDNLRRVALRFVDTMPFARVSGGIVSEAGTRNLAITAGEWWECTNPFTTAAFDSSGADTFTAAYSDGAGGWTEQTSQTQVDNTYYDDGSGTLAEATVNHYLTRWVYIEADGHVVVTYGAGNHVSEALAEAEAEPARPQRVQSEGRLLARIIIRKAATSFTSVSNVTSTQEFTSPSNHNSLAGLQGGEAGYYSHLTEAQATSAPATFGDSAGLDAGVANGVATLDAGGLIPASQIPPTAFERLVTVADEAARFALTTATVQNGDTVKQTDTDVMYFVVDDTNLGNAAGYADYKATVSASGVSTATLGSPTHVTDVGEVINHAWSAGSVYGFGLTDNLDGTVDIAAGEAMLRTSASDTAPLVSMPVPAVSSLALTDNSINYIYVDYNAGTPQIAVTTLLSGFNCLDKCVIWTAVREGTVISHIDSGEQNVDSNRKHRRVLLEAVTFRHVPGGCEISETGTRNLAVTAGAFYYGLTKISHDAIDTSGTDSFVTYHQDGVGGWTRTSAQTQISNTLYDDGSGTLATAGNNKFITRYFYLINNTPSFVAMQYGQAEYNSLAEAQAESPPAPPPVVTGLGALLGRIIYEKDGVSAAVVESAFNTHFVAAQASTHNGLSGLQGGTLGEYYHLTGAELAKLTAIGTDDTADSYTLNSISTALTGPSSVVAVAAFSVADDADGGAWVDKMAHTSWEQAWGKFPTNFTLVLEPTKLWIFDASNGTVWASFTMGASNLLQGVSGLSDIGYRNGRIFISNGDGYGSYLIDLPLDQGYQYGTSGRRQYLANIASANSGAGFGSFSGSGLVNNTCNAVAVTALDGAPLNYVGLPVNTVAVFTGGGISLIKDDETVVNSSDTASFKHGVITEEAIYADKGTTSTGLFYIRKPLREITAGFSVSFYSVSTTPAITPVSTGANGVSISGSKVATARTALLSVLKENPATPASGMVAYITNTYATPYMKGDVEVCLDGSALTDRSVTGTVITDNGTATFTVVNGGDLKYTTASGGTITAPVTTGGECYGWERVGGVWVFRSSISEWVGVSEATGTLTIADGTIFTRLVYVNGAAPSSEQLSEIERTDTALFASGAAMLLPGASSAVLGLDYNEARDELTVTQSDYVATFRDLVRVDSVASQVGTLTCAAADRGALVQGGSTGAHLAAEAVDVKAELAAANQRIAELGRALPPYAIVGSSTTTVALPAGQRAVPGAVIFSGSSLLHEGAANDWTQNTDGYIWTVTFAVAQTGNISIPVERVKS